ncbi:hypothetical protein KVH27_19465 [Streptomyces olivaceus]|uniref:hypothetical protein n=1 Tax=Streptomyces olivaceus TaxID=47716 RepID=UPI001CCF7979|nr:hypothetical protein [Streptomyces olivaceus]MBZ6250547.1 hypothetical protein [Streptomyces olivaceus]
MSAPTCCGKSMSRDGSQWVCGSCGSWVDPGTASRPALTLVAAEPDPEHERAKEPLPIRPHPRALTWKAAA